LRIWLTVWPRPTETMLATANTMTERSSSVERTAAISLLPIPAARPRCEKVPHAAGVPETARPRGHRAFLAPRSVVVRPRAPARIAPRPCPARRSLAAPALLVPGPRQGSPPGPAHPQRHGPDQHPGPARGRRPG